MEKKVDCRPKINHASAVERYKHDAKYFKLHTTFAPNLKTETVTGKVTENNIITGEADPVLLQLIENKARQGPKDKWSYPVLTSHVYGWYCEPFLPLSKDRRFRQPCRMSEISKFGAAMMKAKSMMK